MHSSRQYASYGSLYLVPVIFPSSSDQTLSRTSRSDLRFHLLEILLQPIHIRLLGWPQNAQSFSLAWFGDNVEVDVVHDLVRQPSVVLQDVILVGARGARDAFSDGLRNGSEGMALAEGGDY